MELLVIDTKKNAPRNDGLTEAELNDPAFDKLAVVVIEDWEYTWMRIAEDIY